jgi:hypothetical protein
MPQDYLLRLIDQISIVLAEIARLMAAGNRSGALAELNEQCRQTIGLNITQVQQMSPEAVAQLFETAGGLRQSRAIILAELLLKDAEIHPGDHGRESLDRLHAFCLLAQVIHLLDPDDQRVYRQKLNELRDYLGRMSNNPYIAGKLAELKTAR